MPTEAPPAPDFVPTAKVICDSVSPAGKRLTTLEMRMHRFVLAEFNTHRMFCLAGDAQLEFDLPAGSAQSEHRLERMRLDELVDKWHHGARRTGANPKRPYDLSWVDPAREYTVREVAAKLGMANNSPVYRAHRAGQLAVRKGGGTWWILGQAVLNWRNHIPEHTRYRMRDRLRDMRIRQMDEKTGRIRGSHVEDAIYSGEKEVFEVSLVNGMTIAGSKDHRVLTAVGWKTIEQLTTDDLVRVRKHGTPEDERKDADRLRKIDGRWRSVWQRQMAEQFRAADPMCRHCRQQPGMHVHHLVSVHIDPDRAFDETNVTYLCQACHTEAHQVQGWQGGTYLYAGLSRLVSVRSRGIEPTYDLTIAGAFPNFVANGVIVHNSRNSASSRAIPVQRTIARVEAEQVYPVAWPHEQKGMQGGDNLDADLVATARQAWRAARADALTHAKALAGSGVHKSVVNRLLEPFMSHTVVVSATEWDNFWTQRISPLAQPEMRAAAEAMKAAYDASEPSFIDRGRWHLPYICTEEREEYSWFMLRRVAAARCARVSYLTHDGRRDIQADLELFDRLATAEPPHASPFEHVATPILENSYDNPGNFRGWLQLRHMALGR